jgi:hypothetical protein
MSKLKRSIVASVAGAFALILTGCTHSPAAADTRAARLPLGLYQVVGRQCAYPPGVAEDCSRTRYIEFARGVFRSLDKDEVGMATWLSADPEQEHDFNIRDLRQGKFVGDHEYVIEDSPLGKEWLAVNNGTITDYYFVRHARKTPAGDMAGRTHFTLRRTARTAQLNRLLRYPAADE